jgi:hypothetical protein
LQQSDQVSPQKPTPLALACIHRITIYGVQAARPAQNRNPLPLSPSKERDRFFSRRRDESSAQFVASEAKIVRSDKKTVPEASHKRQITKILRFIRRMH